MLKRSAPLAVAALAGLSFAGIAGAQQLDAKKLGDPEVQAASCKDIVWQKELLARYPRIADACQEVIISDGGKFARFSGELERVNGNGTVVIDFKDRQGTSLGHPTLQPTPNQRVQIEGKRYSFSELKPGQQLSLYVPESRFAIATEPGAAPEAMAQIVPDEPVAPAAAAAEPTRLAAATPAVAAEPATKLPATAGSLALLALGGVVLMLGGLALTARRRRLPPGAA